MDIKKLQRQEAIDILNEYLNEELDKLKWFRQIKSYIKAIIFYGSTAKELNKAKSDLDILIFVPLSVEEKYTIGEYFYLFKNREINIVLRSIEGLRKLDNAVDVQFQKEVFRNCEIMYQSDSEVNELINRLK